MGNKEGDQTSFLGKIGCHRSFSTPGFGFALPEPSLLAHILH
jgi:hypothetical protein